MLKFTKMNEKTKKITKQNIEFSKENKELHEKIDNLKQYNKNIRKAINNDNIKQQINDNETN